MFSFVQPCVNRITNTTGFFFKYFLEPNLSIFNLATKLQATIHDVCVSGMVYFPFLAEVAVKF